MSKANKAREAELKRLQEREQEWLRAECRLQRCLDEVQQQVAELSGAKAGVEVEHDRYVDLFDTAPVGYFAFDDHGIVKRVNRTGAALLGVDRYDVQTKTLLGHVAQDHIEMFYNHLNEVFRGNRAETALELRNRDGSSVFVECRSVPVTDPSGTVLECRTAMMKTVAARERSLHGAVLQQAIHDIVNHVSVIEGNTALLLHHKIVAADTVLRRLLDPVASAAGRIHSIARSLQRHEAAGTLPSDEEAVPVMFDARPDAAAATPVARARRNGSVKKILVMDDEALMRDVMDRLIRHCGHIPVLAEDGHEALWLYQREMDRNDPFDAVILDLVVKDGMGGKETMERLRQIDPNVRAAIASACAYDPAMRDFRHSGIAAVLEKPFTLNELQRCLQKLLQSGVQRQAAGVSNGQRPGARAPLG